jgi:hypothetical protein
VVSVVQLGGALEEWLSKDAVGKGRLPVSTVDVALITAARHTGNCLVEVSSDAKLELKVRLCLCVLGEVACVGV